MMLKRLLNRDEKGIGAVEFALVAPVLIAFIIGVSQLGRMFYANADMKSAVAAGARVASLYPVPEDDAPIIAAMRSRLMREGANARVTPTVVRGTENGNSYIELRVSYSVPLEFIFFTPPPVTLHDSRKVFTQIATANATTYTGTTSTSTSATSASSSTSATSAGGTTSSTTTGSTGGDSSTSSGSNASSGNNNGSSGHAHGNCNNRC